MKFLLATLLLYTSFSLSAAEEVVTVDIKDPILQKMNRSQLEEDIYLINDQVEFKVDYQAGSKCILEFELHGLKFTNDELCEKNL
ncbi:MAG: hypothetical protein Fur0010_06680 [Bdellovibrio sp.]